MVNQRSLSTNWGPPNGSSGELPTIAMLVFLPVGSLGDAAGLKTQMLPAINAAVSIWHDRDSLTDRNSRVIRKRGQAASNAPPDRLHQLAPRIGENGDTVGRDPRRTALVWRRKPQSDTIDHDRQQLRRPVLYPTELRARIGGSVSVASP